MYFTLQHTLNALKYEFFFIVVTDHYANGIHIISPSIKKYAGIMKGNHNADADLSLIILLLIHFSAFLSMVEELYSSHQRYRNLLHQR